MMKFEWKEAQSWDDSGNQAGVWNLYLMSNKHFNKHGEALASKRMGTLFKLRRAWKIKSSQWSLGDKPDEYWLDADLTLEEAQRAAKLFLCVGRQT